MTASTEVTRRADKARWYAFITQCLGILMIVVDFTIVNVALPSIKADLGLSEAGLAWIVNAYMIPYGGFLLLCGRLGDRAGYGRVFLAGIILFTVASLSCALSSSGALLIASRVAEGFGGAAVSAVSLSLLMQRFPEVRERSRALSIYSFVAATGGSAGLLLGGVLTAKLGWRWIFLVNIPVGVLICLLRPTSVSTQNEKLVNAPLDGGGAILITACLVFAVGGLLQASSSGWAAVRVLLPMGLAALSGTVFFLMERRAVVPLIPPAIFHYRGFTISNIISLLWSAALLGWFFIAANFMQSISGMNALEVGLAFTPANLFSSIFSLGFATRITLRYGTRWPLILGIGMITAGLLLFVRVPVKPHWLLDLLPGMLLLGLGSGIAANPLTLTATSQVHEKDYGTASGIVNTAYSLGGMLGVAVLASIVSSAALSSAANPPAVSDHSLMGYRIAFAISAVLMGIAGLLAIGFVPELPQRLSKPAPGRPEMALDVVD